MATYVLIHGALHGGWCWYKVKPLLEARGHTVVTPDLPSHGDDKTAPSAVTLAGYADRICSVLSAQQEPAILVGHSAGGVAITQAAENCSRRIQALVYLSAYVPQNGESGIDLLQRDARSMLNGNIVPVSDGVLTVRGEVLHEAFYGKCRAEDEAFATARLTPQALAPIATPVVTSEEGWGLIPRYYIECTLDRAVTAGLQQEMRRLAPCLETFTIDSDHSPFFSAPDRLVDILDRVAHRKGRVVAESLI
ncbi:MAG: alpha/beta fold hydrolase [Acidobacteriia bacterium]|nr:alpha/beta fold hydrolase [Terriglobia bacterium]